MRASSSVTIDSVTTSDPDLVATATVIVDPAQRWLIGSVDGVLAA